MKFCLVDKNAYREYRGYIFFGSRPVNVTDKATETLLQLNSDFKRVDEEKKVEAKEITGTLTLKNKGGRPRKVH